MSKQKKVIEQLNKELQDLGLLQIALVAPEDCVPAEVNARYFEASMMQQLIENIKSKNHLESAPLVYRDPTLPEGKYRIISGHHRIDGAKDAGVKLILVFIAEPANTDEVVSMQLAHNAIVGLDDEQILVSLFEKINDASLRLATGLNDEVRKIQYQSLNFRAGTFKEFTVMFFPEDIGILDEALERAASESFVKSSTTVRIASEGSFEKFKKLIIKLKRVENIKSNAVAFSRLIELAGERMDQVEFNDESIEQ